MRTVKDNELKELVMKDGQKAMILLKSGISFFDRMEYAESVEVEGVEKFEAPYDDCPAFRRALFGEDLQQPCVVYLLNGRAVFEGGELNTPPERILDVFNTIENGICGKEASTDLRACYD